MGFREDRDSRFDALESDLGRRESRRSAVSESEDGETVGPSRRPICTTYVIWEETDIHGINVLIVRESRRHDSRITDGGTDALVEEQVSVSTLDTILRCVATLEDVEPTDLDELYRYVDPDALEALMNRSRANETGLVVEFEYEGYLVRARSGTVVEVFETAGSDID